MHPIKDPATWAIWDDCIKSWFTTPLMWRQDGRSASMTAPNGPSQQACILQSMREVSTSASLSKWIAVCNSQVSPVKLCEKSPLRPETRQEISIWQNATAQVGCVFCLLTLSEVSSLKTNRMETTGARKPPDLSTFRSREVLLWVILLR